MADDLVTYFDSDGTERYRRIDRVNNGTVDVDTWIQMLDPAQLAILASASNQDDIKDALADILAALGGTLAVSGPLTAAQLATAALATAAQIGEVQASPTANTVLDRLKVLATTLGEVQANPTANTVLERLKTGNTSLGAIDTKLGGTIAVSGPLTNAQLTAAGLALASKQDTAQTSFSAMASSLASILSTLQSSADLAATLWTDDSGAFYLRRDVVDDTGTITVSFTDPAGTTATPGAGLRPASNEEALNTVQQEYDANSAGTGYSVGDVIVRFTTLNTNVSPPVVVASAWLNLTTGAVIAAPTAGHLTLQSDTVTITSSALPAGAASAANQTTGNSSLASILTALQGTIAVSGPLTNAQLVSAALATAAQIGEVQASPTANTVLDRLKTLSTLIGEVQTTPTANTLLDRVKSLADILGAVTASPTANTIGDRLKSINTTLGSATAPMSVRTAKIVHPAAATFNRPADTTAYAVGDLIANSTTAGSVVPMSFTGATLTGSGGTGRIVGWMATKSNSAAARIRYHFMKTAHAVTSGDNGALVFTSLSMANRIGYMDVSFSGTDDAIGSGGALVGQSYDGFLDYILGSGDTIYVFAQALTAYAPANAETYTGHPIFEVLS